MMHLNHEGNPAQDFAKYNIYIKTGGNRFRRLAKYVIGISIFLGFLMLTIR
jgi:hypothetical protein